MSRFHRGIRAAYLGVAAIWSTTLLAIQWSGRDVGWLFGVTLRMAIGALICLLLVRLLELEMAWHARARQAYLSVGLGLYGKSEKAIPGFSDSALESVVSECLRRNRRLASSIRAQALLACGKL